MVINTYTDPYKQINAVSGSFSLWFRNTIWIWNEKNAHSTLPPLDNLLYSSQISRQNTEYQFKLVALNCSKDMKAEELGFLPLLYLRWRVYWTFKNYSASALSQVLNSRAKIQDKAKKKNVYVALSRPTVKCEITGSGFFFFFFFFFFFYVRFGRRIC